MISTSRYTKQILERYRELESLDGDATQRVMRALERRIANGESSVLGIDVDPPALPPAQSTFSLALGSVAVKVGVAVALAAISIVFGRQMWMAQRTNERASSAPTSASVDSPQPAERELMAATKADNSAQLRAAQAQPSSAVQSGIQKEHSFQAPANYKRRYGTTTRQKAIISSSEATVSTHVIPEVSNRLDSLETKQTNGSKEMDSRDKKIIEEKRESTELKTAAQPLPRDPVHPPPTSQSPRGTVDEEMKLLRAAHSALRAGRPEQALAQLAEHTWRFPNGELAEQRDVAHILALCRAGKTEASRSEARRFLAARPDSPFAGRVRATCAEPSRISP
jgi:hypothetical protein